MVKGVQGVNQLQEGSRADTGASSKIMITKIHNTSDKRGLSRSPPSSAERTFESSQQNRAAAKRNIMNFPQGLPMTETFRKEKDPCNLDESSTFLTNSPGLGGAGTLTECASIDQRIDNSGMRGSELPVHESRQSIGQTSNRSKRTSATPGSPDSSRITPQLLLDNFKDALRAKRRRNEHDTKGKAGKILDTQRQKKQQVKAGTMIETILAE